MTSISDHLTELARRLTPLLDPPGEAQLEEVLIGAGWVPDMPARRRIFRLDDMTAHVAIHHLTAVITVDIRDFGDPQDLVPPPAQPVAADWPRTSDLLPDDYRWLVDTYGPGLLGGYLDLAGPGRLPGPLVGGLRHSLEPDRRIMATTSDGAQVSWLMTSTRPWEEDPQEQVNSWSILLSRPGHERVYDCGLLRFLVLALLGKHEPAATD